MLLESSKPDPVDHFYTMSLGELVTEINRMADHLGYEASVVVGLTDSQAKQLFQGRIEKARKELEVANNLEMARRNVVG